MKLDPSEVCLSRSFFVAHANKRHSTNVSLWKLLFHLCDLGIRLNIALPHRNFTPGDKRLFVNPMSSFDSETELWELVSTVSLSRFFCGRFSVQGSRGQRGGKKGSLTDIALEFNAEGPPGRLGRDWITAVCHWMNVVAPSKFKHPSRYTRIGQTLSCTISTLPQHSLNCRPQYIACHNLSPKPQPALQRRTSCTDPRTQCSPHCRRNRPARSDNQSDLRQRPRFA